MKEKIITILEAIIRVIVITLILDTVFQFNLKMRVERKLIDLQIVSEFLEIKQLESDLEEYKGYYNPNDGNTKLSDYDAKYAKFNGFLSEI
jgi:hypothetical protein